MTKRVWTKAIKRKKDNYGSEFSPTHPDTQTLIILRKKGNKMRIVDYGLEGFASDQESEEIIAKTKHFVESAKGLSAIVYKTPFCCHNFFRYVAISTTLELEIELKNDRDCKSIEMINPLNPIEIAKIYSPTLSYKREFGVEERLNREKHTIQCPDCGKMTIFIGGIMQFCSHCGGKIADENVKFCPKCKDDAVYSPDYDFCSRCGESLLEHPDKEMSPLDFETEDLLTGVHIKPEYMDYGKIIPQAKSNKE